jgi:hypothetical protein
MLCSFRELSKIASDKRKNTDTTAQLHCQEIILLRTLIHVDEFHIYNTICPKTIFNLRILLAPKMIVDSGVWPLEMQKLVKADHKDIQLYT